VKYLRLSFQLVLRSRRLPSPTSPTEVCAAQLWLWTKQHKIHLCTVVLRSRHYSTQPMRLVLQNPRDGSGSTIPGCPPKAPANPYRPSTISMAQSAWNSSFEWNTSPNVILKVHSRSHFPIKALIIMALELKIGLQVGKVPISAYLAGTNFGLYSGLSECT